MRIQGDRLRKARERKGLSQVELAQKIKTSQSNVSRWEKDGADDIKSTLLRGILRELDTTEAYLRGEIDEDGASTIGQTSKIAGIPIRNNNDFSVRIQKSLANAFDRERHTLQDLDDVRAVLRETPYFPEDMDTDRAAAVWLDASAHLRAASQPVTAASLAVAMMALPRTHTTIPSAPAHTSSPPAMESTGIKVARKRA